MLVLCSAAVVGCGAGGGSSGESACAAVVTYEGKPYYGYQLNPNNPSKAAQIPKDKLTLAGEGIIPGCNDQGQHVPQEEDEPVTVYRVANYDTSVVIAINRSTYFAEGKDVPESLLHADWLEWITP